MAYLKIKNFKKAYGDKIIFEDINFSAKKGEFITLLGPSGCGKSTLLSPQKRNIGMVFQNYALFPNLNVFENVAFGLKIKTMDKKDIEKRVNKILKLVELEEYAKTYPHKLSVYRYHICLIP